MRYSFEFKLKCVELYRSGRWPKRQMVFLLITSIILFAYGQKLKKGMDLKH